MPRRPQARHRPRHRQPGLVSAGIESSGDVVAAVLTLFAIRLGGRPADVEHPYGHRRAENLAALGEAAILAGGGIVVLVDAITRLVRGGEPPAIHPYLFAVVAVALAVDATRTAISFRSAAAYRSAALRSNAFHFAGDMFGSLLVLAGLVAVDAGLRQGDSLAALAVAAIVFGTAARLVSENARVLMDTTPAGAQARAQAAISDLGEHVQLRRLRLRESGGQYFADAVVAVAPGQAIVEGEALSDAVAAAVRGALPDSDVVVHLEPRREGLDLRDRALAIALAEPHVREAHDIVIYTARRSRERVAAPEDRRVAVADRGPRGRQARRGRAVAQTRGRRGPHAPRAARTAAAGERAARQRSDEEQRGGSRGWSSSAPATSRASCACSTPTTASSCSSRSSPPPGPAFTTPTSSRAGSRTTSARPSRTWPTSSSTRSLDLAARGARRRRGAPDPRRPSATGRALGCAASDDPEEHDARTPDPVRLPRR